MKKISAKEARAICKRLGLSADDKQTTFWAYDEESGEIYDFDTKAERDNFCRR